MNTEILQFYVDDKFKKRRALRQMNASQNSLDTT